MFSPRLSIRTSASPSPPQSPLPKMVSVHDLLDHTWHYDCVVSPTYSSSSAAASLCFTSPDPFSVDAMMSPCRSPPATPSRSPTPPPLQRLASASQYVSLSSFINPNSPNSNGNAMTLDRVSSRNQSRLNSSTSLDASSSSTSSPSPRSNHQCGDRERQSRSNHQYHSSRISFYNHSFLTVD